MPNLKPAFFHRETEHEKLLAMSCEDVVDYKVKEETKRTPHTEPAEESEIFVRYRTVPFGLLQAIDSLARITNRSQRLVVKCLAHHAVALVSSIIEVDVLNQQYNDILSMHGRSGRLVDILEQIEVHQYRPQSERSVQGKFCAAEKLVSYFSDRAKGTGVGQSRFFTMGLTLSLVTAKDPDIKGATSVLEPFAKDFRLYIMERARAGTVCHGGTQIAFCVPWWHTN